MNNPIKYLYLIPAGIVICTILSVISSCSADDNPPGSTLPAGKYPMTFTTSVGELVVTRGTADDSQWAGGEEVAIQLGNNAASYGEIKEYKAATGGALTPANTADPLYWRNTTETVTAWYPYSTVRPASFTVKSDQNTGDNYQASDFLYTTGTYTYKSSGACALVFKHLPTKVVINLKGDPNGGITEDEIKGATVSIVNQSLTSGTIGDGGIVEAAAVAGTDAVTPKELTTAAEGYQRSAQALLIPQVVRFTKFIKVTIDGNHYYYTPTDAVLNSGSQSTYNITVKKDGLEVSTLSGSWTDDDQSNTATSETATFKIYLSNLTTPDKATAKITDGSGTVLTANNGVYTTSSKTINITYTVTDKDYELLNLAPEVTAGIYTKPEKVIVNNDDYTYTLTDIRTDIWLSNINPTTQLKVLKVGDYYYSDGSFSSNYNMGKTCIGIVFKAGAGNGDDAKNYSGMSEIRGYAVALWDASDKQGGWGIRLTDVAEIKNTHTDQNAEISANKPVNYDGYLNTVAVRKLSAYGTTNIDAPLANGQYWAFKVASGYQPKDVTPAAPAGSSGWYLPSIKQLQDINTNEVRNKFSVAGGSDFNTATHDHYWSSNEKNIYDAWYYSFISSGSGATGMGAKSDDNDGKDIGTWMTQGGGSKSYVRAVLTF